VTLLALLRHGETDWSRERRIQGRTDTGLTASAQATLSRLALPAEVADWAVRCSPLLRCRQTAEALNLRDLAVDERLAEMHWGTWEGQRLADLRERLGADMAANEALGLDFRPSGGESPREVAVRLAPLLAELAAAGAPSLAITHRGVIRAILAVATGWNMLGKPPAKLDWGALHLFRLRADGQPVVDRLNLPLSPRDATRLAAPAACGGQSS
jgi:broad specificity phosphatase PhoE